MVKISQVIPRQTHSQQNSLKLFNPLTAGAAYIRVLIFLLAH